MATDRAESYEGNSDYERVIFLTRSGSLPFVSLHTSFAMYVVLFPQIHLRMAKSKQEFCICTRLLHRVKYGGLKLLKVKSGFLRHIIS